MASTQAQLRRSEHRLSLVSERTPFPVSFLKPAVTIDFHPYSTNVVRAPRSSVQDNQCDPRDSRTPAALYRSICAYLEFAAGKTWRPRFDPTRLYYLAGLEMLRQAWDTVPPVPTSLLGVAMDAGMVAHNAMVEAERAAAGRELGRLMQLDVQAERAALQAETVAAKAACQHSPEMATALIHAEKARSAADRCHELKLKAVSSVQPEKQVEVCA